MPVLQNISEISLQIEVQHKVLARKCLVLGLMQKQSMPCFELICARSQDLAYVPAMVLVYELRVKQSLSFQRNLILKVYFPEICLLTTSYVVGVNMSILYITEDYRKHKANMFYLFLFFIQQLTETQVNFLERYPKTILSSFLCKNYYQ